MSGPTRQAIETVWRVESARLIGGLARFVRNLDLAEDLAQEALLIALERWPHSGLPNNAGAWLMTTAKHLATDAGRRQSMLASKHAELERGAAVWVAPTDERLDEPRDDVLRLVLITCHPVLSRESRVALTLRLVAGLSTAEIARGFLSTEATMAQRLVRAKRTLAEAKVPFEVPSGAELAERVPAALEVVYLIFNEGYSASHGDDVVRTDLCDEAMRLGRMLAALVPRDAEAHGLLALMELQASRARARVGPEGDIVLLADQNRSTWDRLLITRGLAGLRRAEALKTPLGPYTLQAAIAGCHVVAASVEATDWPRVVALYDALVELTGSPVVELNRAVAVSMAWGPAEALELVDELAEALADYTLFSAVRGDLLLKLGRRAEASVAFKEAASRTQNGRERQLLLRRAASCDSAS